MKREDLIPVSEREMADLMRHSEGRVLHFTLPHGDLVWRESPWAVPMLAEWRGLTFSDGAGI